MKAAPDSDTYPDTPELIAAQDRFRLRPRLRFPEFKESGDWEEKTLGEIGNTINGLSGKSGLDFGSGEPYVTYKQVFDKAWIDYDQCGRVLIAENEKQNKLQYGDILFTTSSETPDEVGFASVLLYAPQSPVYLNRFCFSLRPHSLDTLNPEFSRYLFHSSLYRKLITVFAQGSTRYNISKAAFKNLKMPLPTLPEQQKIADCLSSLDDLIAAQTERVRLLRLHKKGLMQGLFPSGAGE